MVSEEVRAGTDRRSAVVSLIAVAALVVATGFAMTRFQKPQVGATADVAVVNCGLTFKARVDTGAALSSIHCEKIEISDASPDPEENVGKRARILLVNERDERKWIEALIADYARIRSIDAANSRYFVRLILKCQGVEKETLVTLEERRQMKYRMLLGREFLKDAFVVDVSEDMYEFR